MPGKTGNHNGSLLSHPHFPVLMLLLISFLIGVVVVRDYGASWDDPKRYAYATNSLKAYLGQGGDIDDDKGPFFVMLARIGTEAIIRMLPGWQPMDGWHLMSFLSFLLGVISFYAISLRLCSARAAFTTTLLFCTQPLLWGHAFINSKDIPFMAFFLASVAAGLWLVDSLASHSPARQSTDVDNASQPVRTTTSLITQLGAYFRSQPIWLVGVLWGMTTSIRVLGPASALLVSIYAILKSPRKALPALFACFTLAVITTYLTWPGMWSDPLGKFQQSLNQSSDFPWEGKVLFQGYGYRPGELPPSYLPTLMALQFTEPALALFLLGLVLVIATVLRRKGDWRLHGLVLGWFFLPLVGAMIFKPPLYDNFRHFLFIIPPIFLLAGYAVQALFSHINQATLKWALVIALILPGIYWNVELHPYQYTYYNSFTGGLSGAFRRYESDYWATSYREATLYLNQHAPQGSRIIVWGADDLVSLYARHDLQIEIYDKRLKMEQDTPTYAVLSTRQEKDLNLFPESQPVFQVGRGGAIFCVVKRIK